MALDMDNEREIQSAVIELRDAVDEAVRSVSARLGVRQRSKLEKALTSAYTDARREGRWPTLRTLDDRLDDDLAGVIGDLTHNDLFRAGGPLRDIIDHNVVFGLSKIPGNGQTTVLAAGFIFSALLLRIQNLTPVPNTIRYVVVVDEAHRVAPFRAVQTMIREGRSKGLAVILATQGPLDLPEVVAHNAQTKICFGLPDATTATMAARKLQPDNPRLPEQIRTLGKGEVRLPRLRGVPGRWRWRRGRRARWRRGSAEAGEQSRDGVVVDHVSGSARCRATASHAASSSVGTPPWASTWRATSTCTGHSGSSGPTTVPNSSGTRRLRWPPGPSG